jgi:predicted GNAT family acetyltransferase
MHAERLPDAATFADRTAGLLAADPVVSTHLGSLLANATTHVERFADTAWFAVTAPDGRLCGAAAQPAGFELMLSSMPGAAVTALADEVAATLPDLGGVSGPRPTVDTFVAHWQRLTGRVLSEHMATRLFRLAAIDQDKTAAKAGGTLTRAADLPRHRDLFIEWVRRFVEEIDHQPATRAESTVDFLIGRDGLWVWCDGGAPVGFASTTIPANQVVRLGLVYTPPELRGRGYASACVTAISRDLLDAGHIPVLFTDLANPTSNRIYQRIGYRPVVDSALYSVA